jgi:hypothetical protein
MLSAQDFEYAMENTHVVVTPPQIIETFGTTRFRFIVVTELLDEAHRVKVRQGRMEAERPRIMAPHHLHRMMLEGFGEAAQEFAGWLESHADMVKILRYGFTCRKTELAEDFINQPLEAAVDKLEKETRAAEEPTALITGVDEAWELCLLKFTADLIKRSAGENVGEWQRRGLL